MRRRNVKIKTKSIVTSVILGAGVLFLGNSLVAGRIKPAPTPLYFPLIKVQSHQTTGNNSVLPPVKAETALLGAGGNLISPAVSETTSCLLTSKAGKQSITTSNVNSYQLTVITNNETGDMTVCVSKSGRTLFQTGDHQFAPLLPENLKDEKGSYRSLDTAQDFTLYALKDITNKGVPDLVFAGFSGGAHCCTTVHIVELGRAVSVLSNLFTGNADPSLANLGQNGARELVTYDDTFAYWNASYATSPMPKVILSFDPVKNKYVVNTRLMLAPTPTSEALQAKARNVNSENQSVLGEDCTSSPNGQACEEAWGYALDLLYSGNAETAKQYINLIWKDNQFFSSQDDFWNQLNDQLRKSQYYSDIFSPTIASH